MIVADQRVVIEHLNMLWFELTLSLAPQDGGTRIGWQQRFDSPEACARMAPLCAPSNEQNLDRLASVLVLQPESIGT